MRILVIRNSAMGDVALMAPVLKSLHTAYPQLQIVLLTRKSFHPFFSQIKGIEFFIPDYTGRHKGLNGLYRLYKDIIKAGNIDLVIDLHDVIRSKTIRSFFTIQSIPVWVIHKGRKEKRELISGKTKHPLKHTVQRYKEAFEAAGFHLNPEIQPSILTGKEAFKKATDLISDKNILHIGIAPFAKHPLKVWPADQMILLMKKISGNSPAKFYLFGNASESARLNDFVKQVPGSINLAGNYTLEEELAIMSQLNFMISMDSANMHMASLAGTKVISIWGATDPFTGFGAWMQPEEYSVYISHVELACRPCTVYGKGYCRRKDHACMNHLSYETVYDRIKKTGLIN